MVPHIVLEYAQHKTRKGCRRFCSLSSPPPPALSAPKAHARLKHSLLSLYALARLSFCFPLALHVSPVETVVRGAPLVERDRDTIQVAESADLKAKVPERLKVKSSE
jgi:hypothetical protein